MKHLLPYYSTYHNYLDGVLKYLSYFDLWLRFSSDIDIYDNLETEVCKTVVISCKSEGIIIIGMIIILFATQNELDNLDNKVVKVSIASINHITLDTLLLG
jgi:hypothetical protein